MNKKEIVIFLSIVILILAIFVLGFSGANIAKNTESKCFIGIKDRLCWAWSNMQVVVKES